MNILALETSCDDTSVALIEAGNFGFKIISSIVSSQIDIHREWGGVVPNLAKREHQKILPLVMGKVLKSGLKPDLLALTVGPGLEPCLWVGVNFGKDLAKEKNLPIVPVNHIEAHILANFVDKELKDSIFPAVCLVVSGGHTQLMLMEKIGKYELLGETRDDAAGECFDKIAKILGLGYPGGPIVSKIANGFKEQEARFQIKLPRPMMHTKDYDFSFSGLKTAVLYDFKSRPLKIRKSAQYIKEMCFEAQHAIIDVLIKKTIRSARDCKANSIILGGGVSANAELRKQFKEKIKDIDFLVPKKELCTDNAVMVGVAGFFNQSKKTKDWDSLGAHANLRL